MKKIVVLMLALCLAVPAISYAGSASSRWDIMIGGNVKVDIGYSDQGNTTLSAGGSVPPRDDPSGVETLKKEYGSQLWSAGETGLNFFVRGPEAWGAKTSAFVAGDFTGVWGGSGYNSFDLVIAQINFDWANTSLSMGNGGQIWGKLPTWNQQVAWAGQNLLTKGSAPNTLNVILTQRFGKSWSAKFGIGSPMSTQQNPITGVAHDLARSDYPNIMGGVYYSSGACGKVGPWQLTFGADGVYGKQKVIYNGADLDDDNLDMWVAEFKFLVPIIPERNGNKAGALYIDGNIVTEQNANNIGGPAAVVASYNRNTHLPVGFNAPLNVNPELAAPVLTGWTFHAGFYFTDQFSINGYYGEARINTSSAFRAVNPNVIKKSFQYTGSLVYDVNPAIRMAVQYDRTEATYPRVTGLKTHGTNSNYRFAAYYFF